jgi:hypothetical protein
MRNGGGPVAPRFLCLGADCHTATPATRVASHQNTLAKFFTLG